MRRNGHLAEAVLDQQTSRGREGCLFGHRFGGISMDWLTWFKGFFFQKTQETNVFPTNSMIGLRENLQKTQEISVFSHQLIM